MATPANPPGIVLHGGAGALPGKDPALWAQHLECLGRTVDAAWAVLAGGGSALDAVTLAVSALEDAPLFNAGRGCALNRDGVAELDAAVMDGFGRRAGAVGAVRHVRNPVQLARCVMEQTRHVLLVGEGAEELAHRHGLERVPNAWLVVPARLAQLEAWRRGQIRSDLLPDAQGTVGAVALDAMGHLAAATSTGGICGKHPGRIGDSPLPGAGTWAEDGVCAVSTTGAGEFFIRSAAAHEVAARVAHAGRSLADAVHEVLHERLGPIGGRGGFIAIDATGRIVMECSTDGMFRAARSASGLRHVGA